MARSLSTILTRDHLQDVTRTRSDVINTTTLNTQIFYAVLLDFMTAYELVGFNAKLNTATREELEQCMNSDENVPSQELKNEEALIRYVIQYCSENTEPKTVQATGRVMLGELLKPRFDPDEPDTVRKQFKIVLAKIGGGSILRNWMANIANLPGLLEDVMITQARKLYDEAKIPRKDKPEVIDKTVSPFGNREFKPSKKKQLQIKRNNGRYVEVSKLTEVAPETNVNNEGKGYITLTDMIRKIFCLEEETQQTSYTIKNIFDYSLTQQKEEENNSDSDDANDEASDAADDEEQHDQTDHTEKDYHQLFLQDPDMKKQWVDDWTKNYQAKYPDDLFAPGENGLTFADVKKQMVGDLNSWYPKWSNKQNEYRKEKVKQDEENNKKRQRADDEETDNATKKKKARST